MGKKLLIGVMALLVVLVGAVLAAPSFIDWGQYKGRIASAVEDAVGRRLEIGGALTLSILPLPMLVAEDVRFANAAEGSAPQMAEIDEVRVRVSLPALLSGTVQVESVRLVAPVVLLERLPSGRPNWDLQVTSTAKGGVTSPATGRVPGNGGGVVEGLDAGGLPLNLQLDSVEIVDGRILYRDLAAGIDEVVTDIDATLAAQSLVGPFRGRGSLGIRGLPLTFEGAIAAVERDRAAPLNLKIATDSGGVEASFTGLLTSANGGRSLRGDLRAAGDRLPALMAALGLPAPPPALARPFAVEGALAADNGQATLDNLSLRLGEAEARGTLDADYAGDVPRLRADLAVSAIDIANWMTAADTVPAAGPAAIPAAPEAGATDPATPDGAPPPSTGEDGGFSLPSGIEIAVDLRAGAVAWRGGVVRQAHLAAELAGGELTIHELTGQMPGSSSLAVFGFIGSSADDLPRLDLTVEARSDNLRTALEWAGVDVSTVPGGRLTRLQAEARVGGTPAEIRLRNLDVTVDTTTLRGAATIVPGARLAMGATVQVGSLNLDAYVPRQAAAPATAAAPAAGTPSSAATPGSAEADGLFAGLDALTTFDANFRVDVETLTWQGVPLHDVHAEGSLVGGRMTVKDTGVGGALGASLSLNGAIDGFGGTPRFDGLTYAIVVPEPARFARGFDLDLPVPGTALGRVAARGTLTGTPAELTVDTRTQAAGGVLGAKGVINGLGTDGAQALAFDLGVTLTHPDTRALVALAAPGYQPRGSLGALALATQVSGQAGLLALSGLDLSVGGETLAGDATIDYTAVRPFVQADLTATRLTLDRFLPAEQQAWLGVPGLVPVAAGDGIQLAAAAERWSREPLDLAVLRAVDMAATLRADSLVYAAYALSGADVQATLKAGLLDVPRLQGTLFGGALAATAVVDASTEATQASTTVALDGFQLGQLLRALDVGQDATGVGRLDLTAATSGDSEAGLISNLDGEGTLLVNRLNVEAGAAGRGGAQAVLGPIVALNQLGGLGQGGDTAGTLDARFVIDNGVVRFQTLSLDSNLYGGTFQGQVDLPRWTLDVEGEAKMSQNLLTGLLGKRLKLPDVVPVSVSGPLDSPRVRVQTGRAAPLAGEGVPQVDAPVPPPATVEEALPQLLDQFIGGNDQPADDGQPAQEKPRTEDLMRGLLKELQRR